MNTITLKLVHKVLRKNTLHVCLLGLKTSWSPSTGYMIHYDSGGGHSGNETVSGGSTDSYILTCLHNGETYNISIAALSIDLPSSAVSVEFEITLSE